MSVDFSVYTIDEIAPLLDRNGIIDAVRDALIKHSRGQVQSPMPGQLVFDVVQGDCRIKFGHIADSPRFAAFFFNLGMLALTVNVLGAG